MFPAKIYVGQIAVVFGIVVTSTWGATQWTASALGYQDGLGSPWFTLSGYPVYLPWRLFEWWYAYEAYAPEIFERAGAMSAGGGLAGALFAVVNSVWRARQNQLVTTYGSARWATHKEIADAGLFRSNGVFLGRIDDDYLRHDGPEHVMCFAPTRSGKGVGLVLPTLLSWTSSAVVHDIKGENWHLTAGWRSRFSHCLLFDPTDTRSARYNPLLEVRKGAAEVRDVQNIADILVDPEGALERRTHWEKTSHALLVGVTGQCSASQVASALSLSCLRLAHRRRYRGEPLRRQRNGYGRRGARGATPLLSMTLRSAPAAMRHPIVAACASGFQAGEPGP
jgi:type IV secretion system protein VirD4